MLPQPKKGSNFDPVQLGRESMVGDTLMVVVDSWWKIDLGDTVHQQDILNIVVD